MTYRDILKQLRVASTEQLDQEATVYLSDAEVFAHVDDFSPTKEELRDSIDPKYILKIGHLVLSCEL